MKLPFITAEGRFYTPTQNQDGWVSFDVRNGLDAHVPAIADANIDVSAENVTLDADQLNTQSIDGYYLKANRMYSVEKDLYPTVHGCYADRNGCTANLCIRRLFLYE